MATTIQISEALLGKLKDRKITQKESYEEVIWDLLEDSLEISEETKRLIREAELEFKAGKTHSHDAIRKELGI